MLMVIPREISSGALSIPSNEVYLFAVGSCDASTFVMAAVRVVLPWSTWPIVPMLRCGLFRANVVLAIWHSEVDIPGECRTMRHPPGAKGARGFRPPSSVGRAAAGGGSASCAVQRQRARGRRAQ